MAKETVKALMENGHLLSKFGRNNFHVEMDGTDLLIRIDTSSIALNADGTPKKAGSPNPTKSDPHKLRVVDLIATSSGFKGVGTCQVSCNVTS